MDTWSQTLRQRLHCVPGQLLRTPHLWSPNFQPGEGTNGIRARVLSPNSWPQNVYSTSQSPLSPTHHRARGHPQPLFWPPPPRHPPCQAIGRPTVQGSAEGPAPPDAPQSKPGFGMPWAPSTTHWVSSHLPSVRVATRAPFQGRVCCTPVCHPECQARGSPHACSRARGQAPPLCSLAPAPPSRSLTALQSSGAFLSFQVLAPLQTWCVEATTPLG